MPEPSQMPEMIRRGDGAGVAALTQEAVDAGTDPEVLINEYLIPTMDVVGDDFGAGRIFLPEMLIAANAMKAALAVVEPLLKATGAATAGKVVIGTVHGDVHDIGKNLVASMLTGGGFEVHDLGVNVPPEEFVEAVEETGADIVALSALLTTTMVRMRTTIEALEAAGVRGRVKVMVGGAPVTEGFAGEIGADGFGTNANEAVDVARHLVAV